MPAYAMPQTDFMTVNGVQYRLADDLAVLSDGELIELMDINSVDALTLRGFDYEIHSICVDRGHGYLRLKNDESFIGGWIEVGSELIVPITKNMLAQSALRPKALPNRLQAGTAHR